MATRLPLMEKTPFQLDPKPLPVPSRPHAGALTTARAFRTSGSPEQIYVHLYLRQRACGRPPSHS